MKNNKTFPEREKILKGMDRVYENLVNYKKMLNSDLIVYRDGKVLHIKPE